MELETRTEEIDLLELLVKSILSIYRNKLLFLVCITLSVGITWGYFRFYEKPTWNTQLMISTQLLNEEEAEFILTNFHLDTPSIAKSILAVKTEANTNQLTQEVFVTLTLTTNTPETGASINNVLINYIKASGPGSRKIKEKVAYFSSLKKNTESEIQRIENARAAGTSANIKDLNVLVDRRVQFEHALRGTTSVNIVESLSPKPVYTSSYLLVLIGVLSGAFFAGGIITFRKFLKFLKQYQKSQP